MVFCRELHDIQVFSELMKLLNNCTMAMRMSGQRYLFRTSDGALLVNILTPPHTHTHQKTFKIFILSNSYTATSKLTETQMSVNSILTESLHGHYVTLVIQWYCNLIHWDKNYPYRINFEWLTARKSLYSSGHNESVTTATGWLNLQEYFSVTKLWHTASWNVGTQ